MLFKVLRCLYDHQCEAEMFSAYYDCNVAAGYSNAENIKIYVSSLAVKEGTDRIFYCNVDSNRKGPYKTTKYEFIFNNN